MSSPQDHAGRLARLKCFPPTWCTQTPPVAGPQTGKAEFWHRRRKIIAAGFGKFEKCGGHDGTDGVTTDVLSAGVAAAVSKKSRHRFQRADFQPVTEDIAGCVRPAAALPAIIPQHRSLPCRCPRTPATDGRQGLRARPNRAQRGSCAHQLLLKSRKSRVPMRSIIATKKSHRQASRSSHARCHEFVDWPI